MAKVKLNRPKKAVRKAVKKKKTPEQLHRIRVRAGKKSAKTRKANLRAKKIAENEARIRQGLEHGPFTDDPSYNRLGQYQLFDKSIGSMKTYYSSGAQHVLNMIYNYGYTQIKEIADAVIDAYGYEWLAGYFRDNYFREKADQSYATLSDLYAMDTKTRSTGAYKTLGARLGVIVRQLAAAVNYTVRKKGKRRY